MDTQHTTKHFMNNDTLDNTRISKHLGQQSKYKSTYDPSLLVAEPRINNRKHLGITDDKLPFVGFDTWNAYEVSALTDTGRPVSAVAKLKYPCDSPSIVESKSIKLYFNSFNMQKCGKTQEEAIQYIVETAAKDLSELLETGVSISLVSADQANTTETFSEFNHDYITLERELYDELGTVEFSVYQETPELLMNDPLEADIGKGPFLYHSALLKSNCRVTSQPDWGDVYIYMGGCPEKAPSQTDLLKYIVSFRDECHFHEEICETIYVRLNDIFKPKDLVVTCLYARRGGIDINPSRASSMNLLPVHLQDVFALHHKTAKQ
jgi:7-cyano-7-deazaguanine reductase